MKNTIIIKKNHNNRIEEEDTHEKLNEIKTK